MSRFIEFQELPKIQATFGQSSTKRWGICNKRSGKMIGKIEWYKIWNRYCFFPETNTVYSADCLRAIERFLSSQNSGNPMQMPLTLKGSMGKIE